MEVAFSFPLYCGQRSGWSTYHRDSVCAGHDIQQHVHLHGGASADILYEHCFQRLRPEVKSQLNPATTSLTGFTEKRYGPMGQIRLRLWLAIRCTSSTAWMDCYGDQITSPYNGIYWKDRNIAIRAVENTTKDTSPVRQKKRGQAPERAKAILEEVHKLVEAGIMREVYYHDWLSNPVMVKKSDGSWRNVRWTSTRP
ncbi:hypothetical protein Tco_1213941 [Tanacetum coccineum]